MKIGMIGAGAVSAAVARYALAVGHRVVLSSRSGGHKLAASVAKLGQGAEAAPVTEAVKADVVLLAVPWPNVEAALSGLPDWSGRVLVDATNPFVETHPNLVLADLGGRGASEIVASLAPGARLVKAFNSILMSNFEAGPERGGARRVLFVSGDAAAAKRTVKALIRSFGFAVVDLGGLQTGGRLQQPGVHSPDVICCWSSRMRIHSPGMSWLASTAPAMSWSRPGTPGARLSESLSAQCRYPDSACQTSGRSGE